MKFQLLDFQRTAADEVLAELRKAQARWDHDPDVLGAVVLEAVTGAGKTVIATAVIEELLFGSDGAGATSETTILWVTNDPSLNAQTARKMQEASESISDIRFIGQGATFNEESFEPGAIYFINTQAASVAARISKRSEFQDHTIWETIANTVEKLGSRFIVFVDEAHYGVMERQGAAPTVLNRILNGDRPVPVFVGISATAGRLNKALEQQSRLSKNVVVPIEKVRRSGLVKDRIILAPAAFQGEVTADTTFVRMAVKKVLDYEARWADYASQEDSKPVVPALVIQLPDRRTDEADFQGLVRTVVETVVQEWPSLTASNVVHTFADRTPIELDPHRVVRYMAPQDIQDASQVRVILAKHAITTGWDCPRAEVLVSLRASEEHTAIAQLIGRIVRQPLARRIASDESLNRVHAYLPRFDPKTVMAVVGQFAGGEAGATAEVIRLALDYRAPTEMRAALESLAAIPSYVVPAQSPTPEVKRLHALATLFENDGIRPGAAAESTAFLNAKLDDEKLKLAASGELEARRNAVSSASVFELSTSIDGSVVDGDRIIAETRLDAKNIDDVFRRASRALRDGTAEAYWAYLVDKDSESEPVEAKITVAAMGLTPHVVDNVDAAAGSLVADWFKSHAKAISLLPETDRVRYSRLQTESRLPTRASGIVVGGVIEDAVSITVAPELTEDELRETIQNDSGNRWSKHLYQDSADGLYWKRPHAKDGLERKVLNTELRDPQLVGWYRNPTGGERALCIPYFDSGANRWARLFPDFVFFHEVGGAVKPSIVDPHGMQLIDWADKLRGYVDYAAKYASEFRAVWPVTEIEGDVLLLPIHDAKARDVVSAALEAGENVEAIFRSSGIAY